MPGTIRPYNRNKAVEYAHRWAYSRNPAFYNYDKLGGDCTNFASQCIFAGAGVMNYRPVTGWFYRDANHKSPSWTGVEFLRGFLVRTAEDPGPFAVETGIESVQPGDIVQLSFDGVRFQHSPVIVSTGPVPRPDNILIAAHTIDCDNRPLNSYTYIKLRFLHISGIRQAA